VPDDESRAAAEQLIFEMDANGVDEAAVVCAGINRNPDNNDYVAEAVTRHPNRLHQIADLDCSWSPTYHTPGAGDRLRELCDSRPIKGFTHYVKGDDDGWLVSEEGMAMFGVAAERGLIASVAASPAWQSSLRRVAERYPELPILCHHLAGVRTTSESFERDMAEVLASARHPSICVKVSGFYYASHSDYDYPFHDVGWIVRTLYEHFGPHRLCWGSDYPVVRRFTTYRQAIEVLRTHCPFIPDADKDLILGGTLRRLLRGERAFTAFDP
jgi:predicted TIM-barrel fold metal-dependent hydrolase